MKMLMRLSDYLDDVEDSLVKRFKLSLKFYTVISGGIKVAKDVYELAKNVPDILENLVDHRYVTVDNVDLLETVIKNSVGSDDRYVQLYQDVSSVIEDYKNSMILFCESQVQHISIASLPVNSQYIIVSTCHYEASLRHEDVEEIGDGIFSALSLPKLYSSFCGYEGNLVELCWSLHEQDCLKNYHLEIPSYDHYQWLRHLGVLTIKVINGCDCQVINLQLIDYIGCLCLPKDRSSKHWVAEFYCVPGGYENNVLIKVPFNIVKNTVIDLLPSV